MELAGRYGYRGRIGVAPILFTDVDGEADFVAGDYAVGNPRIDLIETSDTWSEAGVEDFGDPVADQDPWLIHSVEKRLAVGWEDFSGTDGRGVGIAAGRHSAEAGQIDLNNVTRCCGRSYEETRVAILEFLDTDVFEITVENCVSFLDPMIESWHIDLKSFGMEIVLKPRLAPERVKRLEFVERDGGDTATVEPGLEQFLRDPLHFLKQ